MMFVYLLIAFALCSRPGRLTFLYDCLSLVVYIDVQLLGIWYLVSMNVQVMLQEL